MHIRSLLGAAVAIVSLLMSGPACAQGVPAGSLAEQDLRSVLLWNSPWEGRAAVPGRLYSYRTTFHARRDAIVAEVVSYSTNQRSDSVVSIQNGRLFWQDANGAEVNVALAAGGELIGTATSQTADLPIVLKPRP
jgi:hypothetical protein